MPMLTPEQVEKLAEIIKKHATWFIWRTMGNKFVTQEMIDRLKREGLLPMDVQVPAIEYSFVLGRLESLLKEARWKNLSWDQLKELSTERHTPLQEYQIEAAELSANTKFRGLADDIQNGLYDALSRSTGRAVTEAFVKDRIAEEIKEGLETQKRYLDVVRDLRSSLKEGKRNWHRVAATEMHSARQQGTVNSILSGEDVYERAEGKDSYVAIRTNPDACKDCKRLYLDPKTGHPKIFKLSYLMENEGSNYIRPWRQNIRPVVPPAHPHCFCRLSYVPPGWGWDEEGRFTVIDRAKYAQNLKEVTER